MDNKNKSTFAAMIGTLVGKITIVAAAICMVIVIAAILALALKGFLMLCGWLF